MRFNATRLTCFALISAIESDARALVLNGDNGRSFEWPSKAQENATQRYKKGREQAASPSHSALVDYLDFADSYEILLSNVNALAKGVADSLRLTRPFLSKLATIRNRVAHSRPMEVDDVPTLLDVCRGLTQTTKSGWPITTETILRLESDPAHVLGLTISLPTDAFPQPAHNLPAADFDETGFFGRGRELQRIKKALLGPWPVISILGDGGIGKTSIALKAAYDLLDDPQSDFEVVVWVSAKATTLTTGEIRNISGAIQDSLGLFKAAAEELGAPKGHEDAVNEVLEYLENFRVLLILDNLETINDQRLRDFLVELPNGSKVLITSRIGLGMENPVKLEPLSDSESKSLLRALASIRNVRLLKNMDDASLDALVRKLQGHPLYIKWLVAGVQAGRRPSELVNDNSLLLDFCMSNVFDKLTEPARTVLQCMQVMRGARSQGELAYLTEMAADDIQVRLLELMTTNFVTMTQSPDSTLDASYESGDFASQYLARHVPVPTKFRNDITARSKSLASLGVSLAATGKANKFDPRSVDVRGHYDVPSARLLVEALRLTGLGSFDSAIALCREAQTLSPTYPEAWRVEAAVQARRDDRNATVSAFERALELDGDSSATAYHFGRYLIAQAGEVPRGLSVLRQAIRADPSSPEILIEIAEAHYLTQDFMASVDTCAGILERQQAKAFTHRSLNLAMRAASAGAEAAYKKGKIADGLEFIEAALGLAANVSVDILDKEITDGLLFLVPTGQKIARIAESDEYLSRRAVEYVKRLQAGIEELDPMALSRVIGQVKTLDTERRFGFVRHGRTAYFFHYSDLLAREDWADLHVGVGVVFETSSSPKGPRALKVRPIR
jgi:LuxR family glucitol operon transcriptional activator